MAAQDPDQTLQPPTDNAEFKTSKQPSNTGLTEQPPTGNGANPATDELQPTSGKGGERTSHNRDALELQAPSSNPNTKSNTGDAGQDPGLTLQPNEPNPSKTANGQDTAQTLQPPQEGQKGSTDTGTDTSDTKNPLKKAANYLKKEATRQTDGPPTTNSDHHTSI